jgi:Flp pilus assembly protein TadD
VYRVRRQSVRFLGSAALVGLLALGAGGCTTVGLRDAAPSLASASTPRSDADSRRDAEAWGERYRANPRDATAAMNYAKALTATERRAQAVSVLEQATLQSPHNSALLGAYGRALAAVGRFDQAIEVLSRAHSPDKPDWRVLSAHGAVLDQMGRHQDAQRYYASALKIVPDEPTVLSNLGLSYALAKDLARAEETLRKANAQATSDPRVRQNLALVLGLQGRFAEAEGIARADLSPDQATANVAYLRQMIAQHNERKAPPRTARIAAKGRS